MPIEVVVAGAGWAGLSAAIRLVQAGFRVRLLDSAPQPGGRAREVRIDFGTPAAEQTAVLDAGQHLLVGAYRECLELAAILHRGAPPLERAPLLLRDTAGLRIEAAALPAPLHLLVALLRARGLTPFERWSAIRLIGSLRARRWRAQPGETVDRLLARHRQPAPLIERLWSPLCLAALNTASEYACASAFTAVLRDTLGAARGASDFVLPRTTLSELIAHPAVAWLRSHGAQVSFGTTLRAIERDGADWLLRVNGGVQGDALRAGKLILATPAWTTARLLAPLSERAARLAHHAYEAIGTVYLAWPQQPLPLPLPRWIMLRESVERRQHGQWLFDRGVHGGQRIAAVVVSARGRLSAHSTQIIVEGIATQVAEQLALPLASAQRMVTEKRATFRCTPDRPRIAADAFADVLPGLWLAGDYVDLEYPATLETAVRSGRIAAGHVAHARDAARDAAPADQPQAASSA